MNKYWFKTRYRTEIFVRESLKYGDPQPLAALVLLSSQQQRSVVVSGASQTSFCVCVQPSSLNSYSLSPLLYVRIFS